MWHRIHRTSQAGAEQQAAKGKKQVVVHLFVRGLRNPGRYPKKTKWLLLGKASQKPTPNLTQFYFLVSLIMKSFIKVMFLKL